MFSLKKGANTAKHREWPFFNEYQTSLEKVATIFSAKNHSVFLSVTPGIRHQFLINPAIAFEDGRVKLFVSGIIPKITYDNLGIGVSGTIKETIALLDRMDEMSEEEKTRGDGKRYKHLSENFRLNMDVLVSHFHAPQNLAKKEAPVAIAVDPEKNKPCVIHSKTISHFESDVPAAIKMDAVIQHFSKQNRLSAALIKALGVEDEIKSIQKILDNIN